MTYPVHNTKGDESNGPQVEQRETPLPRRNIQHVDPYPKNKIDTLK